MKRGEKEMNFEVRDFQTLRTALDAFCNFLREACVAEDSIFDSRLVLSELANNVLQHSSGVAIISGEIREKKVEVEVRSSEPFVPPEKSVLPDCTAECGRGLFLIDKIGERRYLTPEGGIRVVIKTKYKT
jgi:anti-sigma regulatory factor (Ser/Thr protein kinase)